MVSDIVIAIIIGYLLGSFPSAYLAGRLKKGIDIRKVGSKNMGAVNVYYEVGPVEAALVTLTDLGKGIGAIFLMRWLSGLPLISEFDYLTALVSIAAVIGHVFPVFLKFRGGKGGATIIGIFLFLMPLVVLFLFVVFVVALLITRNPTFSYGLLFIIFPFIAWLIYLDYHGELLILFSIGLGVLLGIQYIPRIKEMHNTTGGEGAKLLGIAALKKGFRYAVE